MTLGSTLAETLSTFSACASVSKMILEMEDAMMEDSRPVILIEVRLMR